MSASRQATYPALRAQVSLISASRASDSARNSCALPPASTAACTALVMWLVDTVPAIVDSTAKTLVELGDIKQANNVPAGSLDAGWGENAGFVAEAAATGIFDLINKFR